MTDWLVRPYEAADAPIWDAFVRAGKNSTFLFCRGYMDYHSDRFEDRSLMVYRGTSLEALLPANRHDDTTVASHGGLTYGGLVVRREAPLFEVLGCLQAILRSLSEQGVTQLLYRRIPSFYSTLPDDEISYATWLLDAPRYRTDTSAVIVQADRLPFDQRRRRALSKANRAGMTVSEGDFESFWRTVLEPRLASRHGVRPVHTLDEIRLLASRFPEEIRQFCVFSGAVNVAGVTIYETPTVAHAQYIASTDEGRASGALELLFSWLIDERYRDKHHVDFGTSNENEGRTVNAGLLTWKEGFGARIWTHEFYRIATADHVRLDAIVG
jgi:hypothetical protein